MFKQAWDRLLIQLSASKKHSNLADYWKDRAKRYGKRSVLNIAHGEDQFDSVTDFQQKTLFPLLNAELVGSEKVVLDFGCGPGRFTRGLSELIDGHAVGVDITPELLELAPKSPNVLYQCIDSGILPFPDFSFDVVWSCLVLGGIPDDHIQKTISEIERVLRPQGLFFYAENTSKAANSGYWFFRDENNYIRLGSFCKSRVIGSYEDMGQTITVFAGRKS